MVWTGATVDDETPTPTPGEQSDAPAVWDGRPGRVRSSSPSEEKPEPSNTTDDLIDNAIRFVKANKMLVIVGSVLLLVGLALGATGNGLNNSGVDDTDTVDPVTNPCSDEVMDAPYETGSEYWDVDQRAEREQACYDAVAESVNE